MTGCAASPTSPARTSSTIWGDLPAHTLMSRSCGRSTRTPPSSSGKTWSDALRPASPGGPSEPSATQRQRTKMPRRGLLIRTRLLTKSHRLRIVGPLPVAARRPRSLGALRSGPIVPCRSPRPLPRGRAEGEDAEVVLRGPETEQRFAPVFQCRHPVADALLGSRHLREGDVADSLVGRSGCVVKRREVFVHRSHPRKGTHRPGRWTISSEWRRGRQEGCALASGNARSCRPSGVGSVAGLVTWRHRSPMAEPSACDFYAIPIVCGMSRISCFAVTRRLQHRPRCSRAIGRGQVDLG